MNKTIYTWNDLERDCRALSLNIALSTWIPTYVVGISRGGCTPAVIISHLLRVPIHTLKVSLRSDDPLKCESICWMSEDAFG